MSALRRCAGLLLVDRTLLLREADDGFRWTRAVWALVLACLVVGLAAVLVVTGGALALLPSFARSLAVQPQDVLAGAVLLSCAVVLSAAASLDGQEVRSATQPFDAAILRAAGFRSAEVFWCRLGLPAAASALVGCWIGAVALVSLRGLLAPAALAWTAALCATAVLAGLAIRTGGAALLSRTGAGSARRVVVGSVLALVAGFALPTALDLLTRDVSSWREVAERAGLHSVGTAHLVVLSCANVALAVLGAVLGLRGGIAGLALSHRRAPAGPLPLSRAPWQVLLLAPFHGMARSGSGDSLDARIVLVWTLRGAAFVAGLHASGARAPGWAVQAETLTAVGLLGVAYAVHAVAHPQASLLAHRRMRNVLYAAETHPAVVSCLVMASGVLLALAPVLALWAGFLWLVPGRPLDVLAHLVIGLVLAVTSHFLADALLRESQRVSHERVEQTLPQRIVSLGAFAVLSAACTAAGAAAGTAAAAAVALAAALAAASAIHPRAWGRP